MNINAQYCECALRDPQLISRAEALTTVVNLQTWLTDGFAVLFGLGLFAAASLARAAIDDDRRLAGVHALDGRGRDRVRAHRSPADASSGARRST